MRIGIIFLFNFFIVSCGNGKESIYTGSTPADTVIRSFLEISFQDSVDFIRWRLVLRDNQYQLQCNYGISKPNTDGFINGGRKIELTGEVKKEKNYYQLQNHDKTLKIAALNADLLHFLNTDNSLLAGNGGWSYTLNSIRPVVTNEISIIAKQTALEDSIAFEGRTPCDVPDIIPPGTICYKLKWYIILYANKEKSKPGHYKIFGTPWRKEGGRTGSWEIITGKNGRIIYQLNDDKQKGFLYLLKLDENILVFTDKYGKLLAGDKDFSYTLNQIR